MVLIENLCTYAMHIVSTIIHHAFCFLCNTSEVWSPATTLAHVVPFINQNLGAA